MIIRTLTFDDLAEDSGFYDTLENLTDVRPIKNAKQILEKMQAQGTQIFVAEIDEQIVGTVSLLCEQTFIHQGCIEGHIEKVATRKGYEGKGIATALMNAAIQYGKDNNFYRIILDASDELIGYYERFGFVKTNNGMRLKF